MKKIKSILNLLIFRRNVDYETHLSEAQLLVGLKQSSRGKRNIEGKILKDGFELFFTSDIALIFPTQLPLLEIKGKIKKNGLKTVLRVKIRLSVIPKFIFPFGIGVLVLFYLLEKYTNNDFGGISDSIFPLFSIPFAYGFLQFKYLMESERCKSFFGSLIHEIEKNINIELSNSNAQ